MAANDIKIDDLRQKSDDQLIEQLTSLKREQFNLRFQQASGQLEKTGRVREIRRDVARILTMMNQRRAQKAEADGAAAPATQTPAPAASEPEVTADA